MTLGRRLVTAVPALVVLVLGALNLLQLRTSAPVSGAASAQRYSAERAWTHLRQIAVEPHPVGSPANDRVRTYLTDRLAALGLRTEVQNTVGAVTPGDRTYRVGRVANLSATIAGSRPGADRIVIVGHYDSVATGPGATDDGIALATMLEVARALTAGPRLRNDVVLLFTDGEEAATLGARAAATGPGRTVLLNLDARGTGGPVIMFQTGPGNGRFLPALAGTPAVATSLSDDVYRLVPNDTDFSRFLDAGFTGMNFAVIGGSARYHTEQDDLAHVDRGSLQDMGDVVLAATRSTGSADLTRPGGDLTYFTLFGLLVRYPAGLVLPLALMATLLVAVALRSVRGAGARPARVAVAAVLPLAAMLGCALLGWLAGLAVTAVRPDYRGFLTGDPYHPGVTSVGIAVAVFAGNAAWLVVARRRLRAVEALTGAVLWFALLAVVTAAVVPGAAYLFTWPALLGAGALLAARWIPADSRWQPVPALVPVAVAAVLLAPVVLLLVPTVGLSLLLVPLAVAGLLLPMVVVTVGDGPARRRTPLVAGGAAVVVGVLVAAVGLALDRIGPDRPRQVALVYAVDADAARPRWLSSGPGDDGEWIDRMVGGRARSVEDTYPMLQAPRGYRAGDAPAAPLASPAVTVLSDRRTGDVRELRFRLTAGTAPPGAPPPEMIAAYLDTTGAEVLDGTVRLAGTDVPLPGGRNRAFTPTAWKWGLELYGTATGPAELTVRIRTGSPVRLRVVTRSAGIPAGAFRTPRPATTIWSGLDAGQSLSARTITLP